MKNNIVREVEYEEDEKEKRWKVLPGHQVVIDKKVEEAAKKARRVLEKKLLKLQNHLLNEIWVAIVLFEAKYNCHIDFEDMTYDGLKDDNQLTASINFRFYG